MSNSKTHAEMEGWLYKWTNCLKGYQRRWFVLSDGLLSYYKNQTEMVHLCRGSISLKGALIHTEDSCGFIVSNGSTHTFYIKADSEVERQQWVTALELAKPQATRKMEFHDEKALDSVGEVSGMLKNLSLCLEQIKTGSELICRRGTALQRTLSELESLESVEDVSAKIKHFQERATSLNTSSKTMINTYKEFINLSQIHTKKWLRIFQNDRNRKEKLEEIVEHLLRQHSMLEQAAKLHILKNTCNSSSDDDEDNTEFYECEESENSSPDPPNFKIKFSYPRKISPQLSKLYKNPRNQCEISDSSSETDFARKTEVLIIPALTSSAPLSSQSSRTSLARETLPVSKSQRNSQDVKPRRTRIPDKPNYPLNLWSILKGSIGKDLSKMPMPVNFSEPISLLQRLTEDYEYSYILDYAATLKDSCEQLAYVAAFSVSSYSCTANRTGKPFNPLLGETYEWDRMDDLGFRVIAEQVSHHPPMVAQYVEGKKWKSWQEFSMSTKFRGKYIQVVPLGISQLRFDSGNQYSWRKVTTTVHNIIVGKLWIDQHGEMDITNHTDGSKCEMTYIPYSYFKRDTQRKVRGCVMDRAGKVHWLVTGYWDSKIEIAPVISTEGTVDNPVYKTGTFAVAWERKLPPADSDLYYNFTIFACQLNEMEPGVAPTDSRLRPDQRLMELGKWDEANALKVQLEEKQRAARRERETLVNEASFRGTLFPPYEPAWFKKIIEPVTGKAAYIYQNEYWECKKNQDWSRCPNIYL